MEQKQRSFNEALEYGKEGEEIIASIFLSQSFSVMPLYQFEASSAPLIYYGTSSFISPDLMLWKNGTSYYVEVKRKSEWKYIPTNSTGIDKRLYEKYKALSDATGIKLFLFFIQEKMKPTGIYWCEIHNEHTRSFNGYTGYNNKFVPPMITFISESLTKI